MNRCLIDTNVNPRTFTTSASEKDIAKGLNSKEESKRMLEDGAVLIGDTPTQFSAFIKSEQARWAKVVEKAKISVD